MDCPLDGTKLVMSERQGVEIDYCPECRGVWLDRGELDKILERAEPDDRRDDRRGDDDRDDRRRFESGGHHPKKKRSFLTEIFEFGGE
ncbi:MAG: zf-TFIIB domain-containing protein [Actinomycetota bacterium]|nr:zf-TFIIB domain-containing protein [Actinomycetota bacterium]